MTVKRAMRTLRVVTGHLRGRWGLARPRFGSANDVVSEKLQDRRAGLGVGGRVVPGARQCHLPGIFPCLEPAGAGPRELALKPWIALERDGEHRRREWSPDAVQGWVGRSGARPAGDDVPAELTAAPPRHRGTAFAVTHQKQIPLIDP